MGYHKYDEYKRLNYNYRDIDRIPSAAIKLCRYCNYGTYNKYGISINLKYKIKHGIIYTHWDYTDHIICTHAELKYYYRFLNRVDKNFLLKKINEELNAQNTG